MIYLTYLKEYHLSILQNYNNFFNPNICHVCKKSDINDLILCKNCYMISYCSSAHQLMHHAEHNQFCEYITQYLIKKNGVEWRSICLQKSEWIQFRYEILHETEKQFPRQLQLYEKQMILFAKSCYFCHRQDKVFVCSMCYSFNYCVEHKQDFQVHYFSNCLELRLCLSLSIFSLFNNFTQKFVHFPNNNKPVDNMISFLTSHMRCYDFSTHYKYLYSDYVSGPLTFYYGMKEAGLLSPPSTNNRYLIHVITSSRLECKYIAAWELLLHGLRNIKLLTIILIGPALEIAYGSIDVCISCLQYQQNLRFKMCPVLYQQYTTSRSYQQPNVIVRFEADVNKEWTMWRSLLSQYNIACPLFFTATSQSKAEENINIFKINLPLHPCPVYNSQNKFQSLRPWIDFETASVWYRNKHVTVYKHLGFNLT